MKEIRHKLFDLIATFPDFNILISIDIFVFAKSKKKFIEIISDYFISSFYIGFDIFSFKYDISWMYYHLQKWFVVCWENLKVWSWVRNKFPWCPIFFKDLLFSLFEEQFGVNNLWVLSLSGTSLYLSQACKKIRYLYYAVNKSLWNGFLLSVAFFFLRAQLYHKNETKLD